MLETVLVPAATKGSRRLMIVLHGLGDSTAGYEWLPPTLQLPWMNYLLVNAPEPYYGGYSWFDFPGDPQPGIERSRKLLVALLEAQRAAGFPTEQTVLFGFSQGSLMTLDTGLRYPHRFAGLIGISGFLVGVEELVAALSVSARSQHILVTHGTRDPLLPFGEAKRQIQRLQSAGVNITWREFVKEHTIAGHEELALIREFVCAGYPDALPDEARR
jgi:predicted esterase